MLSYTHKINRVAEKDVLSKHGVCVYTLKTIFSFVCLVALYVHKRIIDPKMNVHIALTGDTSVSKIKNLLRLSIRAELNI